MKISVVIPCHNAAAHLPRAVHSVVKQGLVGTEVIVVDDASNGATVAVAEQLRTGVPNLRIIREPTNGGVASACNAGLAEARGEYVCFLDPEDSYGDDVFARALAVLDEAPWIQALDFPIGPLDNRGDISHEERDAIADTLASNVVVRREFVQSLGGFPGSSVAFRAALREWGNIWRLDDVFLDRAPRLAPDASNAGLQQGVSEHSKRVAERMRAAAGIKKTRVLHVSGDRGNFKFEPFDFETFDTDTSFRHAKETLQGRTYPAIPFLKTAESVLDIGANIGASAVTFALRYPHARIVAVEPSRQPFVLLRCNTSSYRNIECYNIGLFGTTVRRQLFAGRSDSLTNSVVHSRFAGEVREDIQLVAADIFAEKAGVTRPDIIKIDTEGCELPILSSMLESFRGAKVIYLEYHSEDDRIAIDRMLAQTHILYSGKVPFPHRGEFVYVRNDAFPAPGKRDHWRIGE